MDAGLAGLARIEGDRQAPPPPGEPERPVAGQVSRLRSTHGHDATRIEGVIAVHEGDQRAGPAQDAGLGELEEAYPFDAGQEAIGEDRDGNGGLRGLRGARGEKLRLHPDAGGSAAHHDGVAAGGATAAHRAIFQLGEAEGAVAEPGDDVRVTDERNGSAVPVVPQGPAAAVVQLEA